MEDTEKRKVLFISRAMPWPCMPMTPAAALDKSMMRPAMYGPRSLIVTVTDRPFARCVTRTRVPNGRVLCAAVMAFGLNQPPEATRCGCQ